MFIALAIDPRNKTPIKVPTMFPLPPLSAVPPMTTMAIVSISRPCPSVMIPVLMRARSIVAPIPTSRPWIM